MNNNVHPAMPHISVKILLGNILFYKKLISDISFQGFYSLHTSTVISHGAEERHCEGMVCTLHVDAGHICLWRHNWRSNILMKSRSVYSEPAKQWIRP